MPSFPRFSLFFTMGAGSVAGLRRSTKKTNQSVAEELTCNDYVKGSFRNPSINPFRRPCVCLEELGMELLGYSCGRTGSTFDGKKLLKANRGDLHACACCHPEDSQGEPGDVCQLQPPPAPKAGACAWRNTGVCLNYKKEAVKGPCQDRSCDEPVPERCAGWCDCNGNGKMDDDEWGYNGGERFAYDKCPDKYSIRGPNKCSDVCAQAKEPWLNVGPYRCKEWNNKFVSLEECKARADIVCCTINRNNGVVEGSWQSTKLTGVIRYWPAETHVKVEALRKATA